MPRSVFRPDQLDVNGSYNFAQLVIDGYSGGCLDDGYLTGLILETPNGTHTLELAAANGAINQIGQGQVTFSGNVHAKKDVLIDGSLTVLGPTTSLETQQLVIDDPIVAFNATGSEIVSDWVGITARDNDGYNRFGWVFDNSLTGDPDDGYWGITIEGGQTSDSDAVPTRALAYIKAGDSYGDLSSTLAGDSGASKIGTSAYNSYGPSNVQAQLEELHNDIVNASNFTDSNHFTINNNALAGTPETTCLIMKAADMTHVVDGYLCMVADAVNGNRMEFRTYSNGTPYNRTFDVGPLGSTNDVNACVVLNSGNGVVAKSASLCLDGYTGTLKITAPNTHLTGNLTVDGYSKLSGDVHLGSPGKCITFDGYLCSSIIPCCNDAYSLGSPGHSFLDAYISNVWAQNQHIQNLIVHNIIIQNETIDGYLIVHGLTTFDGCVEFAGGICSNITPCCNDAYEIGSSTKQFKDGYIQTLHSTTVDATTGNITTVNSTTVNATTGDITTVNSSTVNTHDLTATGDVHLGGLGECIFFDGPICSNITPCCNDAYSIGDSTHQFKDGYIQTLHSTTVDATTGNITTVNSTTINTTNITATNNLVVQGDTTLGNGPEDCITFGGVICSNMIPCCNDAYTIGDPSHKFNDGYFHHLTVDNFTVGSDVTITGNLIVDGNTILGNSPTDCIILNGSLCSDIIPCCNDAYQIGNASHTFKDAYFYMPMFTNITPVGNIDSLIGVLKGIDNALTNAHIVIPRGIYYTTAGESSANELVTTRAVDGGVIVDVGAVGVTDAIFGEKIYVYLNGQLLWNDPTTAVNQAAVQNDVARLASNPSTLVFKGHLRKCSVVQIVDLR